jgi:hypothetical protein
MEAICSPKTSALLRTKRPYEPGEDDDGGGGGGDDHRQ